MSRIIFTVINDLTYDQRMHRICNSLTDAGYEVLLVGRKLKSSVPLQQERFQQRRMNLIFSKGKFFYIGYNIRLFFFLLFEKFDIVCGIDLDTILPCYFISKIKNKKCVYDAHELFPEVPEVIRRPSIQKMWRRIEKFSVLRIRSCYTVSNGLADYFNEQYGRKFEVVRNMPVKDDNALSVRSGDEKKGVDSSLPVILYQGALNEGRGVEAMIDAMPHLDCKLILAGEGDLSSLLRKKVSQLNLQQKVIFVGKKNAQELHELAQQSFIGINLLENKGLNYYYSLANKFFDYVHASLPQITMSFPEYKTMNQEFGVALLIDDLAADTLINAVNKLLRDRDFYIRLRDNCLLARNAWNWQNEEKKLIAIYHALKRIEP